MKTTDKAELFETSPIPVAVTKLCIPTVLASLVMVLYNLADTFFVGELDSAVQNAGVTLVAPILLAFNAVNNLFGVGTSSKMSRALGSKDYDTVYRSSAFGFYSALFFSIVMAIGCTLFKAPLMRSDMANYFGLFLLDSHLRCCAGYHECGHILPCACRGRSSTRQCGYDERLCFEHHTRPRLHTAVGT